MIDGHCKVAIHLSSGKTVESIITSEELEDRDEDSFEDLIETVTSAKPGWDSLGDVCFYLGRVEAIEILDIHQEKGSA